MVVEEKNTQIPHERARPLMNSIIVDMNVVPFYLTANKTNISVCVYYDYIGVDNMYEIFVL